MSEKIFDSVIHRKTDDGRDVAEVQEKRKKQILPSDILKEIANIEKSIMHFEEEKERLQQIYAEISEK